MKKFKIMKKSRFPFSLSIVVFLVAGVQAQRVGYVWESSL